MDDMESNMVRCLTDYSEIDRFCFRYYQDQKEYLENITVEQLKELVSAWGNGHLLEKEKDLNYYFLNGDISGLKDIYTRESTSFEDDRDITVLTSMRYFKTSMHVHSFFEIECVYSGTAIFNPGDNQAILKTGDIVLVPPMTKHIVQPLEDATVVDIELRLSTFENVFQEVLNCDTPISSYFKKSLYGGSERKCIILKNVLDNTLRYIVDALWSEYNKDSFLAKRTCVNLMKSFIYHLADTIIDDSIVDEMDFQNDEMYLIRKYMLEHIDTVTLKELAEKFYRSESSISRFIMKKSGMGFSKILANMRLKKAEELLASGNEDVAEISAELGYCGESHFIACFKKKYGMTPLKYRKNIK